MGFLGITKSMEEAGKVILCTDVFYFIRGSRGDGDQSLPGQSNLVGSRKFFHENKRQKIYNCECRLRNACAEHVCSIATDDRFCFVLGVLFVFLKNIRKHQDAMTKIF